MAQAIADNASKAIQLMQSFHEKWAPLLSRQSTRYEALIQELITDPLEAVAAAATTPMEVDQPEHPSAAAPTGTECAAGSDNGPELSFHAQYMLEENLAKLRSLLNEMLNEHRAIHPPISRCGKELDKWFQSDLSNLMKNEKVVDSSQPENLQRVNRLIYDYLMSLGRVEVAETLARESELDLRGESHDSSDDNQSEPGNGDEEIDGEEGLKEEKVEAMPDSHTEKLVAMRTIMGALRNDEFMPAIEWVRANCPEKEDLLFRLHSQHILKLLKKGEKREAVLYARNLDAFKDRYGDEIAHLMFATISYPNNIDLYKHLFDGDKWLELEEEVAASICPELKSPLKTILDVGAKTIPSLITLRSLTRRTSRGSDSVFMVDELPCDVSVPNQVHSTFTCPILKVQTTESNPPMRLNCGHVISQEALNKLAVQSRNQRLKCPYCPEESNYAEAKKVYF